ncbi:MAG: ATP-binding protein [Polyangiaceae bacterium]
MSTLSPISPSESPRSEKSAERELTSRLVRLNALRLVVLTAFLGVITLVYLRGQTGGYSSTIAFFTVVTAFALAALSAAFLRKARLLVALAYGQIITDQVLWSAIVFITGGITSGAVSLYGLTCVTAAIARGVRGAVTAFVVAAACYGAIAFCLIERVLAVPPDQTTVGYVLAWNDAAYPMFANLVALALVAALSGYLAERLRSAGGALVRAEARAQAAEQLAALGRLAAGLAHEIRNPLGGIAGATELLGESPNLTDEDRQLCQIIRRETTRLNDLVGDMLHLARPREPIIEVVDVTALAHDVVMLSSRTGRGEDVRVVLEGGALHLRADPAQLRQLLWNLVRNAVQASSPGDEVVVRLEKRGTGGAELAVIDHGPGIGPDSMEKLFDAFYTTRSHGTGVGLAVVKRIVDSHHWTIEVASANGATFRVVVPAQSVVDRPFGEAQPATVE